MSSKILVIAGSLRAGSLNVKLAKTLTNHLKARNVDAQQVDLNDYPMPVFNQDLDQPETVSAMSKKLEEADGVVLCSPEYNASVTPVLKNMLDWVSTTKSDDPGSFGPFKGKFYYLSACSPGGLGGIRGLYHLRAVLMNVGAEILTPQLAVGNAKNAFDEDGDLKADNLKDMMNNGLDALVHAIEAKKQVG